MKNKVFVKIISYLLIAFMVLENTVIELHAEENILATSSDIVDEDILELGIDIDEENIGEASTGIGDEDVFEISSDISEENIDDEYTFIDDEDISINDEDFYIESKEICIDNEELNVDENENSFEGDIDNYENEETEEIHSNANMLYPADLLEMELEYVPFEEAKDDIYTEADIADIVAQYEDIASFSTEEVEDYDAKEELTNYSLYDETDDNHTEEGTLLFAEYYNSEWEKYGNYYVYNKLYETDKKIWDELNVLCIRVLESGEFEKNTGYVSVGLKDKEHMKDLAYTFRYCNPQYFFLKNAVGYTYNPAAPNIYYVGLSIYDSFQSGTVRKAEAEKFFAKLDEWIKIIEKYDTDLDKIIAMQKLICESVEYDNYFTGLTKAEQLIYEKTHYTQSAYSTLCMDYSVCAGYAQAFELLSNAVGIESIAVTSDSHEWNKVRLNDSWYNLDCTWADKSNYIWMKYTLKSDSYYESDNVAHIMIDSWNGLVPPCTLNSTYSGSVKIGETPVGTVSEPKGQAKTPTISSTRKGVEFTVTLTSEDSNADIYYTINGKKPDSAASKSVLYVGPFITYWDDEVKAVAVLDQYKNSQVEAAVIQPDTHKINYVLNGGINSEKNPDFYFEGDEGELALENPEKEGHTFLGWYEDAMLTSKITGIAYTNRDDVTVYAGWKINEYDVTYNYAGIKKAETKRYYYGTYLTEPEVPKRKGYTFVGWYKDANDPLTKWNFETDFVRNDTTIYAAWKKVHEVSFESGYDETVPVVEVWDGNYVTEPEINREGYTLIGWYENPEDVSSKWNFSENTVIKDMKLSAIWSANKYMITYEAEGGECSVSQNEVLFGSTYQNLPVPRKTDFIFDGWYLDKEDGERITQQNVVKLASNHSLYAHWISMDTCSSPEANVLSGDVLKMTKISLYTKTAGAKIYFTTDGSNPTVSTGTVFTEPILLNEDMELKAIAVKEDYKDSSISKYQYKLKKYQVSLGEISENHLAQLAKKLKVETYEITENMIPSGLWVAGLEDQYYTGSKVICPDLTVYCGKKKLKAETDYKVKYVGNKRVGTAKVTVTGKGNYKGTVKDTFKICPAFISNAAAEDIVVFYSGNVRKGTTKATILQNGKLVVLKAGRDFEYDYIEMGNPDAYCAPGTYKIMLKGKGNYQGILEIKEIITRPKVAVASNNTTSGSSGGWKEIIKAAFKTILTQG